MTDNILPPIEHSPPFSMAFVAHLHGGCYPSDVATQLTAVVRRDRTGRQMLNALDIARREVARMADCDAAH